MATWHVRREVHRLRWRMRLYRAYWANRATPTRPLIVVGTARVGSDLLTSYLNSLPDVSMHGEVLNPNSPQGLRASLHHRPAALRHLRACLQAHSTPIGGVKIMLNQLELHGLSRADLLECAPCLQFVVLYRRSLAAQYVSLQIAKATGVWRLTESHARRRRTVRVDPEALRRFCDRRRAEYAEFLADPLIRGRSLVVAYEDLACDSNGLFRTAICPFLDVPYHAVRSGYVALNPAPLADKVDNFEEVADALKDAHMSVPHRSGEA